LALKPTVGFAQLRNDGVGPRHETTQGRPATAIPVVLCDPPGVKTKILSTKKKQRNLQNAARFLPAIKSRWSRIPLAAN